MAPRNDCGGGRPLYRDRVLGAAVDRRGRDRYSMPIVLGLFAFAGSIVGGVIALIGLVRLVRRAYRRA